MKINIKATNIELTPSITEYVNKKVSALEKLLPPEASADTSDILASVEVGKVTEHHKSGDVFRAEVHLSGQGLDVYADTEQNDLYAAIDIVKDEILHSLEQSKGKRETLTRKGSRLVKYMMKGLTDTTSRSWSWSTGKIKGLKELKNFRKKG